MSVWQDLSAVDWTSMDQEKWSLLQAKVLNKTWAQITASDWSGLTAGEWALIHQSNIYQAFRSEVIKDGSIIRNAVAARMYPETAPPQPEIPFITYTRLPAKRIFTHDGPDPLVTVRISLTVWSDYRDMAYYLAEDIRKRLNGFTGDIGSSGIEVKSCMMVGDHPMLDTDTQLYGEIRDFLVQYLESLT